MSMANEQSGRHRNDTYGDNIAARDGGEPAIPAATVVLLRDQASNLAASKLDYTEDREALCSRLAAERGMTMIPPYDHPHVMAGQGTAALELIEDAGPLDALLVCVGGGGLISGCAVAAKHLLPDIAVYGVEPEAGNDTQQSLRCGEIVKIDTPRTIADGAQTQSSGKLTFPVIQALVKDVLTVSDAQLVQTMRFFASRMKLVVEPTGGLAAAALLEGAIDLRGQRVGVIVSGGNVDLPRYAALLQDGV